MAATQTNSNTLLQRLYTQLDFESGVGFYHVTPGAPPPSKLTHKTWIEQAHKLGAQAVFFVGDFPTVLFFKCDEHLAVDNETIE
ncbi:MAG: hypothetical protein GY797_35930, partial [Deltaproteobacteria bacterium]|nr:hypothetical protein [Deltaproteobacteria bacterium]